MGRLLRATGDDPRPLGHHLKRSDALLLAFTLGLVIGILLATAIYRMLEGIPP